MSARGYIGAAVMFALLGAGLAVGTVVYVIERTLAEDGDPWNG